MRIQYIVVAIVLVLIVIALFIGMSGGMQETVASIINIFGSRFGV